MPPQGLLRCKRCHVLQVDTGPETETSEPRRSVIQLKILDKILTELINDSKSEVRSAACVWLVSLCTFTGRQPQLLQRLPQIQEAFSNLLGDSSELAQVGQACSQPMTGLICMYTTICCRSHCLLRTANTI